MAPEVIKVRARPATVEPIRPETFAEDPVGVVFPAGTQGFTKVTNRDASGPGTYVGFGAPPTTESARRRLQLPSTNRANEARSYVASAPLIGSMGVIAGSRTKDVQVEMLNPEVLEEVSRWKLPADIQVRLGHCLAGAAAGGFAGLAIGAAIGNPWLGLAIGLVVGFFLGLLFPTDWNDLLSVFFGAADKSFLLLLA
jgi:hypothetical protein